MWSTFWAPGHWFMTCHRKSGSGYLLALVITMTMYCPLSPDWMVLPDHGASKQAWSNTKIISCQESYCSSTGLVMILQWLWSDFPSGELLAVSGEVFNFICVQDTHDQQSGKGLQRGSGKVVRFLGSIHLGEYLENLWSCLKKLLFS